jgi:tRNA A-37 threonylcarbamoyl transferase component Bud32
MGSGGDGHTCQTPWADGGDGTKGVEVTEAQILAGRYELGAVLGRGGMAEVRAGWDRRLSRAVAIKTLLPDLAERPGIRERFEGEARAAARLAHPNAVAVFDVGEEEGVPFLVMEQVVGPSLEQELAGGPLDVGRVVRLGTELLAALGAAHAAGLVHRDVKPANVLITKDGTAKVADFGIAKAVAEEEGSAPQMDLTTTGQMIGTVAYMAPERLAGRPATVQSDLYSVGVVLYETLSGTRPFAASTPIAVVRAVDQASPVPLRECRPGLEPRLIAVVERAMAKNPEDRFASAADMAAALEDRIGPAVDDPDAALTVMARPATEIFAAPVVAGTEVSDVAATNDAPVPPVPAAGTIPAERRPLTDRLAQRRVLALVAGVGLAVALGVAAFGRNQHGTSATATPTTTVVAPPGAGAGLPPALDGALVRLEKTVR